MLRAASSGVLAAGVLLGAAGILGATAAVAGAQTTAVITANPGTTPQSTGPGGTFSTPLGVTVECNGSPVSGAEVTFSIAPGSSGSSGTFDTPSGATTQEIATGSNGGAGSADITTVVANDTPGTFTATASITSLPTGSGCSPGASVTFDLSIQATTEITATGGTPQTAKVDSAFQPLSASVTCVTGSAAASPVDGATVTFTAPSSGASGVFATTDSDTATVGTSSGGTASAPTFTANDTSGSYTVTATVSAMPVGSPCTGTGVSAYFDLTNSVAGVPAQIETDGGTPQSAAVGTAFASPLGAEVLDGDGDPVSGVSVTFSIQSVSGATATFATGGADASATTNASGVAESPDLTAGDTTGSYTATAAVQGVSTVATYDLTNAAGPPDSVTAGVGSSQQTAAGTAFPIPLAVTVTDADHNDVPGVAVTFGAPASGASGTFAGDGHSIVIDTNSDGIAVAPTFTANDTVGGYIVTASVSGVSSPAVFTLVNQVPTTTTPAPTPTLPHTGTPTWLVGQDGAVFAYGSAVYEGGANAIAGGPGTAIVGMAAAPSGQGYWLVGQDGAVFAYGSAAYEGGANAIAGGPGTAIVGMAAA